MQVGWICVARVAEAGALAVRPPGGRDIAAHGVGREEEDIAVAAAGQDDRVGQMGLDRPVTMSRAMMPRARPSTTTSSSISCRECT